MEGGGAEFGTDESLVVEVGKLELRDKKFADSLSGVGVVRLKSDQSSDCCEYRRDSPFGVRV